MRVPEFGVLRHDRTYVALYELAEARPVALVFLRHLGCIFCREQVATLRDAMPDANIAFVTMADPIRAARFKTWMRSPHPFLCDPERRLYKAFGVERTTPGNMLRPAVVGHAIRAYRKGFRNALSPDDSLQLGGTYVMDCRGTILAAFPAGDAGDYPSPEVLRNALG